MLKAAFVQGRLDRDEFELRVGRVLASRTYADLAALTAGIIPARLIRARPLEPARESVNKKKAVAALSCATLATVGMLVAVPPLPDGSPFAVPVMVLMCILFGAVSTCWLLLLHTWLDERAGRRSAPGLPPGSGGEASPGPGTGRPGRAAPAGRSRTATSGRSYADPSPPSGIAQLVARRLEGTPPGRRYAIGYPATDTARATRPGGYEQADGTE